MPNKRPWTLLLPPALIEALGRRAAEEDTSMSEIVRRAIRAYLAKGAR
jgi:metal-responsive CopG/Arc/MetJ family transcriptional regulator